MAQVVKKPPAMWETWVRSLGWEDTLEKGKINKTNNKKGYPSGSEVKNPPVMQET